MPLPRERRFFRDHAFGLEPSALAAGCNSHETPADHLLSLKTKQNGVTRQPHPAFEHVISVGQSVRT